MANGKRHVKRRARSTERGLRCPACGYDLRGLGGGCCPECGQDLAASAVAGAREEAFFRSLRRRLLVLGVVLVAASVLGVVLMPTADLLHAAPLLLLIVTPLVPVVLAIEGARWLD